MKKGILLLFSLLVYSGMVFSQTHYYGLTSKGGVSDQGTIFKTDNTGSNLQTVFSFKYHHAGRSPKSVFTQASNGKIYGTTQFGGANLCSFPYFMSQRRSGVIFEYDPTNDNYTVLFNFDDTTTGCWPETAPVLASNGKLYGVTPSIGGFSQHYGTVYSYDLATGVYTKIHSFGQNSDGKYPVGNLLLASDGNLYGLTSDGGFNDKGTIFKIDPTTDTYTKLLDMRVSWSAPAAGQDAKSGLIQASNGIMYGTTESGGNYPSGYGYAYGNIFKYDPVSNVATNLYGFNDTIFGENPVGSPVLLGTNNLYCITHQYYQIPGTYNQESHYYLWKYVISTGNAVVVDSIANGKFNDYMTVSSNGKIIITGSDYNISHAIRFWEFNPATNTRTLIDTSATLRSIYKGLMLASNGKFYAGGAYLNANNSLYTDNYGSFVEYDASNHTITEKFKFSDPIDGTQPEGDLLMATNGKFYGMTSKGGTFNKGVVFEFNPSNDSYTKKFDLDSLTGYEPKGGLMEASNGKLYGMTTRGGNNSYGAIFEIDTATWSFTKKADFTTNNHGVYGRLTEAWDGHLYGLTYWNGGTIFQYDTTTNTITKKHSFTTNDGTAPQGSLALADNGKLYGFTQYDGQSYYSKGTLFEYDPATNAFAMKKELYNYTGYNSQGNTPLLGSDGKMYLLLSCGGSGNDQYSGGAIDEYIPGATTVTNKAVFSVSNTGSKPMGDLMESANGNLYGYTWIGGANNKGTLFEYNPTTATLSKKIDFDGSNGANPMHGSLKESNTAAIVINQQPSISTSCVGDTAFLTIAATHPTLLHYQWYKDGTILEGATNDTLSFIPISSADIGNYSCKITGGTRAVVSNTFALTPIAKPTITFGPLASSYCLNNADVALSATPVGGTFSGTGVSSSVFSPSNAGVGTYDVIYAYTNSQGCSNQDTVSISVNGLPDASFSGLASAYCNNSDADTLIPTTLGGVFIGNIQGANIFNPRQITIPSGALMVSVNVVYSITDANSCFNADTLSAVIYPIPNVNFGAMASSFCNNDIPVLLNAGSPTGGSYSGSGIQGIIFTPSDANLGSDTLVYSYTNTNACTNRDTVYTTVFPAPDFSLGQDTNICINHVITLSTKMGSGYSYLWSNGSTDSTLTIDASTLGVGAYTYSVNVSNANTQCSNDDDIIVTVDACQGIEMGKENASIAVFPNPSRGLFTIKSDKNIESLEVYSSDGRLVYSEKIGDIKTQISLKLTDQAPGLYYLLLNTAKDRIRKRLIINN